MIKMLSGNEAIARGAWEAGVVVGAAYPGTPSTEILENFSRYPNVYAEWSANEKVALDVAIGAAYAGRRAFSAMKQVGMNVAADAFMYAALTGMEAGLVIVTADDPGMHASPNEQDNRIFAKYARIPCLEPVDSQEAKDLMIAAFGLSERFDVPVLMRLTTRICHSNTPVELGERAEPEEMPKYPRNQAKYVMSPGNAFRRRPIMEGRVKDLVELAETFPYNRAEQGDRSLGVITSGVAYQYVREVFPHASVLRLGMSWPLPEKMIRQFAATVERLIVVEELDPFLEEAIKGMGIAVEGKSLFPIIGELDPKVIRDSAIRAGLLPESERIPTHGVDVGPLPSRSPVLCPGCPHRATYYVLNKLKVIVNGDVGCYTLGMIPPLNAMHTTGAMGSGISVAHGAMKAGNVEPRVAVIGDSTFFHTGMPALANIIYNQSPIVTIIMDNRSTGMTGHQDHPGTGRTLQGKAVDPIQFEPFVRAMGIKHTRTVKSFDVEAIETTLKEFKALNEPAVIIASEPCALLPEGRKRWMQLEVKADQCNGCSLCFRVGCPAILKSSELDERFQRPKALIDAALCTGCEVCAQVCPRDAIKFRAEAQVAEVAA